MPKEGPQSQQDDLRRNLAALWRTIAVCRSSATDGPRRSGLSQGADPTGPPVPPRPVESEPCRFEDSAGQEFLSEIPQWGPRSGTAPIRDDLLYPRIDTLFTDYATTNESVGRFIWGTRAAAETVAFRYPKCDDDRRSVDEISLAELCGLLAAKPYLLEVSQPVDAVARDIGVGRLTKSTRGRFHEAIRKSQDSGEE